MRALVLSSGAAKGSFHIGVLHELILEQNLEYSIITGNSVGAINAAALCHAPIGHLKESFLELEDFWRSIKGNNDIRLLWKPLLHLMAFWKGAVYDSSPLQALIKQKIDQEKVRISGRKLRIGVVSYKTGKYIEIDENANDLFKWIIASSAFPGVLSPVEIDGDLWIDGGVKCMVPIQGAIAAGATEIDVILTHPINEGIKLIPLKRDITGLNIAIRSLDIMSHEILKRDLNICNFYNTTDYDRIKIRIFAPEYSLCKNSFDFDPKKINEMIEYGKKVAKTKITEEKTTI